MGFWNSILGIDSSSNDSKDSLSERLKTLEGRLEYLTGTDCMIDVCCLCGKKDFVYNMEDGWIRGIAASYPSYIYFHKHCLNSLDNKTRYLIKNCCFDSSNRVLMCGKIRELYT